MSNKVFDTFISCKSQDYGKAEAVYRWLVGKGYKPFFAPVSLKVAEMHGEPVVFGDEIDDALEQVENMIVFTSRAEYVREGYVKDEWRTFVEEQRAGRKKGSLVTILDSVEIGELPIRLRSVQSFTPNDYQTGIIRFLGEPSGNGQSAPAKQKVKPVSGDQTFAVNGVPFKMIHVEGGTFQMGASSSDSDAYDLEKPQHSVTLSNYYIGETEVTQALWTAVMGNNPSYWKGDNLPVEQVSWDDCRTFIGKLNSLTGKNFRLPTEAEWEYAARGGRNSNGYKYSGSNTVGNVAWYTDNSGSQTHPVKTKQANELGLYDMSGNVWEWCQDWYGSYSSGFQTNPKGASSGSYRVYRGGSWYGDAENCRVSYRNDHTPTYANLYLGLRLAL